MVCMDSPGYDIFSILCQQLARLSEKLTAAKEKGDDYNIKKYQHQIGATIAGMRKVSSDNFC